MKNHHTTPSESHQTGLKFNLQYDSDGKHTDSTVNSHNKREVNEVGLTMSPAPDVERFNKDLRGKHLLRSGILKEKVMTLNSVECL